MAGVTRIDGCPSDLGPLTTPADTKGFASDEPRVEASSEREQQKQGGGGKMPDRERGRPALWQKNR